MPIKDDNTQEKPGAFDRYVWKKPITVQADLPTLSENTARVVDCIVISRDGEKIFRRMASGRVMIDIVGYAIIPLDLWNGMVGLAENGSKELLEDFLERRKQEMVEPIPEPPVEVSRKDRWISWVKEKLKLNKYKEIPE